MQPSRDTPAAGGLGLLTSFEVASTQLPNTFLHNLLGCFQVITTAMAVCVSVTMPLTRHGGPYQDQT
jgi:hypothetical protein